MCNQVGAQSIFATKIQSSLSNIQNSERQQVSEFKELTDDYNLKKISYKAHPLNNHYQGEEEKREWMFSVQGYFPSFFRFWKECKKELLPIGMAS